jgi:malate dehydrogenase (oxaloacetate-decarboxylating)
MVKSMNAKPIVFAMSNPTPEIMPDLAVKAGAFVVCTGRSDFPNQVNNVLAFPGIFPRRFGRPGGKDQRRDEDRGRLCHRGFYPEGKAFSDYVIPAPFEEGVAEAVARAVAEAARKTGVARI